jgi:hypothetical protein
MKFASEQAVGNVFSPMTSCIDASVLHQQVYMKDKSVIVHSRLVFRTERKCESCWMTCSLQWSDIAGIFNCFRKRRTCGVLDVFNILSASITRVGNNFRARETGVINNL